MTRFLQEVLEYHHQLNDELIDKMTEYGLGGEIKRLFSHMLNAHNIWNARINEIGVTITAWETHSLETCQVMNDMNYNITKDILSNSKLDQVIKYVNLSGQAYSNKIEEIIFHILNHHTHHRAQITLEFRKQGYDPMDTDFISRKR